MSEVGASSLQHLRAKVRALVAPKNAFLEQKAVRELIPENGSIFDADRKIVLRFANFGFRFPVSK